MNEDDILMQLKGGLFTPMAVIAAVSAIMWRVISWLKIILLMSIGVIAALLGVHKNIYLVGFCSCWKKCEILFIRTTLFITNITYDEKGCTQVYMIMTIGVMAPEKSWVMSYEFGCTCDNLRAIVLRCVILYLLTSETGPSILLVIKKVRTKGVKGTFLSLYYY